MIINEVLMLYIYTLSSKLIMQFALCTCTITIITDERERVDYLLSINCVDGKLHTIERNSVFKDVVRLYNDDDVIIREYPLFIEYKSEQAVDDGGVQRDMFTAFWEMAYSYLFEGAKILTPMINPGLDLTIFPVLGRITSHCYLACGILPTRIALPSLIGIILGPAVSIPEIILKEAFSDYISEVECATLKNALSFTVDFPLNVKEEVIDILSRFGCRQVPTPTNLLNLIVEVARYEFCTKPAAAISLIHSGFPEIHKLFWSSKSASDIYNLYCRLTVTRPKVLALLKFPDFCSSEHMRISGYLKTMIGNMQQNELRLFLRFVTGASVCIVPKISIEFNGLTGLGRRPIAHTCDALLELPVAYINYEDFYGDFKSIFETESSLKLFAWQMDAI